MESQQGEQQGAQSESFKKYYIISSVITLVIFLLLAYVSIRELDFKINPYNTFTCHAVFGGEPRCEKPNAPPFYKVIKVIIPPYQDDNKDDIYSYLSLIGIFGFLIFSSSLIAIKSLLTIRSTVIPKIVVGIFFISLYFFICYAFLHLSFYGYLFERLSY